MAQYRHEESSMHPNCRNGLAFLGVALAIPFLLGQSSVGGCGGAVTVPDDQDSGPDETLDPASDETVVDTDGDGFPDEVELHGEQATDPNDPTDNPDNVRDTDGDGCSDFDELYFPAYCDPEDINNP